MSRQTTPMGDSRAPEVVTRERPRRGVISVAAQALGEIMITLGVLLMLVVVYDLWWTNVEAGQAASVQRETLVASWGDDELPVKPGPPAPVTPVDGEAFALIYIPRLKDKVWGLPVVEGVSEADLAKGISHFPDAALPGEVGNFALAGHRATNGEPLRDIDRLQDGDMVYIETETGWYSYELNSDEIVSPYDLWVVDPVPERGAQGTRPTQSVITLLTCNPRWASYERWVWWGELTDVRNKKLGPPPGVTAEGGV